MISTSNTTNNSGFCALFEKSGKILSSDFSPDSGFFASSFQKGDLRVLKNQTLLKSVENFSRSENKMKDPDFFRIVWIFLYNYFWNFM